MMGLPESHLGEGDQVPSVKTLNRQEKKTVRRQDTSFSLNPGCETHVGSPHPSGRRLHLGGTFYV